MEQQIGTWVNWKFGLITREIYRVSEDLFEINDTSDGWVTARVNKETLAGVMNGTIPMTSLEWK
jgi:hypothetical protein